MISLTSFTAVLVSALLSQTTNLSGLLFVSMILQATSFANITTPLSVVTGGTSAYGITPFNIVASFCVFFTFYDFIFNKKQISFKLNSLYIALLVYFLTSILGAIALPLIFDSIPVHRLVQMDGSTIPPLPLHLTISNYAQCLNLLLIVISLIYVINKNKTPEASIKLIYGVGLAWGIVSSTIIYEQAASFNNWPSLVSLFMSNPGYSQSPLAPMGFAISRIGLPFSEPSYASAYLAAMTTGFVATSFFGKKRTPFAFLALISFVALINTLGSTGLFAFFISFILVFAFFLYKLFSNSENFKRKIKISFFIIACLTAPFLIYLFTENTIILNDIHKIFNALIVEKLYQQDGLRELANKRAIQIFFETYGLGVGMGSNRASSFFASLLSNMGIIGFSLFMYVLLGLLWRYWKAISLSDVQIFVGSALAAATLAMGLGIPDLNMPMYWGFIILGFVFCPDVDQLQDIEISHGSMFGHGNRLIA